MRWHLHNGTSVEALGLIPLFLFDRDPRPAAEQFNEHYAHGGGWGSFGKGKWRLSLADSAMTGPFGASALRYPGDPPFKVLAHTILREELILVFNGGPWVVIKQLNSDEFDVARMD